MFSLPGILAYLFIFWRYGDLNYCQFCSGYFGDGGLTNFLPRLVLNHDPPKVARIIGRSHQCSVDFGFDILHGVTGLNLEIVGVAGQNLDKDLHLLGHLVKESFLGKVDGTGFGLRALDLLWKQSTRAHSLPFLALVDFSDSILPFLLGANIRP
jgi:hypothetical protein